MLNIIKINDLNAPALAFYANRNEAQLKHYFEPQEGIFIAESREVILRALDAGYEPLSFLIEDRYLDTAAGPVLEQAGDAPVYTADISVLSAITGYHLTKGFLCAFRRKPLQQLGDLLAGAHRVAVLEDIENPTNLGAVIRSAAALGMDAVLLTPGCCDPLQRRAVRVSVGCVFQILWTFISEKTTQWPAEGMNILKDHGFRTAAMVLKDDALSVDDRTLRDSDRLAVMIGNEYTGIRPETLKVCDYPVTIPMSHGVDSLNAAAAAAIAFWELGRRG